MDKLIRLSLAAILAISLLAPYAPLGRPAAADIQNPANPIVENNWSVTWTDTGGDMIRITNLKWKGTDSTYDTVISRMEIPSIYVDYPSGPFDIKDSVGSTELVHFHKVAVTGGFKLVAEYIYGCATWPQYGCYKYKQIWMFKSDGTFFPWAELWGPGLRPGFGGPSFGLPDYYVRWSFNTDVLGSSDDGFARYETTGWVKDANEDKRLAASPYDGYFDWKIFDWPESGETLSVDPYATDNPTMYYLRYYSTQQDIPFCASSSETNCDDPDVQKFGKPDKWDNNEAIQAPTANPPTGQDNIQWYVTNTDATSCGDTVTPCYPGGNWQALGFP